MPEYSNFRLGDDTLAQLDSLAVSAGSRTQALREAAAYWQRAVAEAGRANAVEFSEEDWTLLGAIEPPTLDIPDDEDSRAASRAWGPLLAAELTGRWEGRKVLPLHIAEVEATRKLAGRVSRLDLARGYAIYACLRWFWKQQGTPADWWHPGSWMGDL